MYEEHFGLSAKPFQLSPDAAFFYPSREHNRALSFLEYGLDQADGFIVVTGDVGTGKTTIVQTLLKSLNSSQLLVANLVTTQVAADELMHLVAASFGLDVADQSKGVVLSKLENLFIEQAQANGRVLLIVDEAQNLPPKSVEELRMLSNFQYLGKPILQIFLLGQEEFRATLLSEGFEQLRQRVIATYHLNPLDQNETRTYIEHRLACVNWQGNPRFLDEAFEAIYLSSEGVPRRINNLCDRLLLFCFLEERDLVDHAVVETVATEIGNEFLSGSEKARRKVARTQEEASTSGQPLETMARVMFDKANVQQRLASLERAVDSLGAGLKPEIAELRDEISAMQLLLAEIALELRELSGKSKRSA